MRALTTAAVLLVVTLWFAPTVAEASFNKQAASAQSASSATLRPPTDLSATRVNCLVTLSWTPPTDAPASGYQLLNGSTLFRTIDPKSDGSEKFPVSKNVSYSFRLVTTYLNWTSSPSQAVSVSC